MPLTVGTAGHIDHGKTWLVRALTGKDTDRLPEEQARGISIDLGYAPLELPDGRRLSLVDVPGHERFVRTMIAGATGIDLFLLVVDAAEGARPQTLEHLAVLRLLGVERGVVAVTKADAVDEETLELALEEARELVPDAEVVPVSAKTGAGLDELRAALARVAGRTTRHARRRRASTSTACSRCAAIGTVATGTLWSGTIAAGDELRVEPSGATVRVRSVQVHDAAVERGAGGTAGRPEPAVRRAHDRSSAATCSSRPATSPPPTGSTSGSRNCRRIPAAVTVHVGTKAVPARVARNGRFAQLRLAEPVVAARGDRVVLRTDTTVGGGSVLDPAPPRGLDPARLEALEGDDPEAIVARARARAGDRPRAAGAAAPHAVGARTRRGLTPLGGRLRLLGAVAARSSGQECTGASRPARPRIRSTRACRSPSCSPPSRGPQASPRCSASSAAARRATCRVRAPRSAGVRRRRRSSRRASQPRRS